MLLARERGLHTCAQEIWSLVPATVGECLGAPANLMLFSGMALGYADPDHRSMRCEPTRAPLEEFASLRGFEACRRRPMSVELTARRERSVLSYVAQRHRSAQ